MSILKKAVSFAAVIVMAISTISGTYALNSPQKAKALSAEVPQTETAVTTAAYPQKENNAANDSGQDNLLPPKAEETADGNPQPQDNTNKSNETRKDPGDRFSSNPASAPVAGVNITSTNGHEHKYKTQIMKPTSRAQGYTLHVCEICGFSYRDSYTEPLACVHNWRVVKTIPASYDSAGYTLYECTECGLQEKRDVQQQISSGGTQTCRHYVCSKTVIPSTCTSSGYTLHECLICRDYSYQDEDTPALGHSWGEGTITLQPTCLEDGVRTYTCQNCGETRSEAVSALDHSWNEGVVTKTPTCSDSGLKTYSCQSCGATRTEELPSLEHDWDEGIVTTQPTCSTTGVKTYTCRNSGETRSEEIDSLPHTFKDEIVLPTETDGGYTRHYCTLCGYELERTDFTDPLMHEHDYELLQENPTCTEDGFSVFTCSICGDTHDGETVNALGHNYVMTDVRPTSENEGYFEFQCSRCDDSYRDYFIPKLISDELEGETALNLEAVAKSGSKWLQDNGLEISDEATTAIEEKTICMNAKQETAESMAQNICFSTAFYALSQCLDDPTLKPVFNCVCREQEGTDLVEICCFYSLVANEA